MIHFTSPTLILTSGSSYVSLYFLASTQSYRPSLGSLCRVRVCLKSAEKKQKETESVTREKGSELSVQLDQPVNDITEAMATAFSRCRESVIQVPLGDWTVLRLGEGQCDITEACMETMRAGEKCEVRFQTLVGDNYIDFPFLDRISELAKTFLCHAHAGCIIQNIDNNI